MIATALLLTALLTTTKALPPGEICNMPLDDGYSCGASIESWYYRPERDDCNFFVYGGCGGNKNRFKTLSECEKICQRNPPCLYLTCPESCKSTFDTNGCIKCNCTRGQRERICSAPLERGNGRALMPRWGWDNKSKSCKDFAYGGLPGNDNNFATREECEVFCSGIQ